MNGFDCAQKMDLFKLKSLSIRACLVGYNDAKQLTSFCTKETQVQELWDILVNNVCELENLLLDLHNCMNKEFQFLVIATLGISKDEIVEIMKKYFDYHKDQINIEIQIMTPKDTPESRFQPEEFASFTPRNSSLKICTKRCHDWIN